MKLLLLTLGGLLLCGCGPTESAYKGQCPDVFTTSQCRDVLVARAVADTENALRIYAADAAYQKGYNEGFRKGLAYPSEAK